MKKLIVFSMLIVLVFAFNLHADSATAELNLLNQGAGTWDQYADGWTGFLEQFWYTLTINAEGDSFIATARVFRQLGQPIASLTVSGSGPNGDTTSGTGFSDYDGIVLHAQIISYGTLNGCIITATATW